MPTALTVNATRGTDGTMVLTAVGEVDMSNIETFTRALAKELNIWLHGGSLAVSIAREGARVAVRVSDTGAGMAPDVVPHVFDPFFTTKERGVGLGLAKVHALVEAHGGSVACDSAPGRGSMFTLSFPAT